MNILAAKTKDDNATNQIYNVALNDITSLNSLYRMIEEKLIQKVEGLEKKKPIYRDFRAGDVRYSQANIDKSKELLGYKPNYRVSEGMNETIQWYTSH